MRKIYLFMNVSLDGYFEDANHDISGFKADFEAFSAQQGMEIDTLLFGHKTYEMMNFWSTPQAVERMPEVAKFMNEKQKFVASHTSFDPGWKNVTVINTDVIGAVKQLKMRPGKDIMMFGSNTLAVSLMQAGLIDEFQIVVNPVAFGKGTALFTGLAKKTELVLTDTHPFKSGSVLLTYNPAR